MLIRITYRDGSITEAEGSATFCAHSLRWAADLMDEVTDIDITPGARETKLTPYEIETGGTV